MKNYLDDNTRIALKWHMPALGNVLALQRKRWYGWRTVSWIYPSIMENESCEYIRHWLEWEETYKEKTQKKIGIKLMSTCEGKF